ncbi:MAG: hypothetical protein HY928_17425 [Elusimicrobia bacterium]|nr:hypothetical protein [Elusimicrobiota bacterium]
MKAAPALFGLLLLGTPVQSAQKTMNASDPVSAAARFQSPAGWQRDTGSFGVDHFVTFSKGSLRLRVQLLGEKGSRYAAPTAFLAGPEAKGKDGKPPAGSLIKAGKRTFRVYTRSSEAEIGPQGMGAPGMLRIVDEAFAVIPVGKRFFVLSLTRTLEVPPESPLDQAPFLALLSSFHPK